jgi:hypothetical protein
MSGGIVQLVATGAQDEWLTGSPQVSFFRSSFKRSTHYASAVERQIIQGAPTPGGISTVRFEKKGDLLSYVYMTARDSNGAVVANLNWEKIIDRVQLYIGGQEIDSQDFNYMTDVEPVVGAQTLCQRYLGNGTASAQVMTNKVASFFPLKFFFCKDWSVVLPLVALQFHDVEIRITWSSNLGTNVGNDTPTTSVTGTFAQLQYGFWTQFVYLDKDEREFFASQEHNLLMTQVQRVPIGTNNVQELALAHPIKFLAFQCATYNSAANYNAGAGGATMANWTLLTQINGVDVGEPRHLPAFVDVNQYYHTQFGYMPVPSGSNPTCPVAIIPFCLDTTKLQPTGTLNFSRIDTYRLVTPIAIGANGLKTLANPNITVPYLYAVNYNVLKIKNGMGGLLYAN